MNAGNHPFRNERDENEIQSADQRDAGENFVDEISGALAGADAGNKASVLAHVVRNLGRVKDNGNVKVRKEDDAQTIKQRVERLAPLESVHYRAKIAIVLQHAATNHGRESQYRRGEDDRHDSAGVHAERQVSGLAAHNAASYHALGVLHPNAALAALYINDESHDRDHHRDQQGDGDRSKTAAESLVPGFVPKIEDAARQSRDDTGEDKQRHAVAHAAFSNLLAQPHNEDRARGQREHGHQSKRDPRVGDQLQVSVAALQSHCNTQRLQRRKQDRQVACPLRDLLPPQLAFLLQLGQRLIDHGQELQNNGGSNVRHDAQGEDGQAADIAAVEHIQEAKEAAAILLEDALQRGGIDARRRNVAAQAVYRQNGKREQHALAKIRDPENIG